MKNKENHTQNINLIDLEINPSEKIIEDLEKKSKNNLSNKDKHVDNQERMKKSKFSKLKNELNYVFDYEINNVKFDEDEKKLFFIKDKIGISIDGKIN